MNKKYLLLITLTIFSLQSATAVSPVLVSADGSTFAGPILQTWATEYANLTNNAVQLSYGMGGSGQGITSILNQTVDFAGSDAPLSPAQQAMANSNGRVINTIPESAGAIVMTYHISTGLVGTLNLTADNIAQIYQQNITHWNDPALTKNNPGLTNTGSIFVVHRSDSSGTSYAFTDYLTRASSSWVLGTSTSPKWPSTTTGGNGNGGVASAVIRNSNSIGYVELGYALANNISSARLQNKAGNWVTATIAGVTAAADSAANSLPSGTGDWSHVSINNQAGPFTYPIATFTYLLVYKDLTSLGNNGAGLVAFFKWIMTNQAQQMGTAQGYVPLPSNVLSANLLTINSLQVSGNVTAYEQTSSSNSNSLSSSNTSTPGFEVLSISGLLLTGTIVALKRKKSI